VDNTTMMEQEKGNDWHNISVMKLKHTTGWKPCVNLVTISKWNPCAIFPHTRFSRYSRLCYVYAGVCPGFPHTVCFPARIPYVTFDFSFATGALKDPIYTSVRMTNIHFSQRYKKIQVLLVLYM
jgi:hypothetical protein